MAKKNSKKTPQKNEVTTDKQSGKRYRLLNDEEVDIICEVIGEQSAGDLWTGEVILLLEHLVATQLQYETIEGEVMRFSNKILAAEDPYSMRPANN